MDLSTDQRRVIEHVINVFETGKPDGDYGQITIYSDGPHNVRQVTYGRSQTTEYGKLRQLVQMYVDAGGTFSDDLRPFADAVGSRPLVDDATFKNLLRRAGREDATMRTIQDQFFDQAYFQPAMHWADTNGFREALSGLVIYDSFIHSGSILWVIRSMFDANPPSGGGSERAWTSAYVDARSQWLSSSTRSVVRATVYRPACFQKEIARANWDLSALPIVANGVPVS
jgi:chitosanase